jgi:hypothetical protein
MNSLSISCDGSAMPFTNKVEDIVLFNRLYQLPSPLQVMNGLDMNNYKVYASGKQSMRAHEYSSVTVSGVTTNTVFAMFAVLHSKDGDDDIFSLKEETVQLVVKTLSRLQSNVSAW